MLVTQYTTWNSCCSLCPHGARKATNCMCGAFIFHDQVQSTVCPCEIPTGASSRILPRVLYLGFNKFSVVITCNCVGSAARCRRASRGATPPLKGFSLRTHKISLRCQAQPFKEGESTDVHRLCFSKPLYHSVIPTACGWHGT